MRILLVEDDPIIADAVAARARADGHAVDRAATAAQAQAFADVAAYDLVLLDLGLPDEDGLTLLRRLRSRSADMPVIVLTARDSLSNRIAGLNAGADDYLVKPFDLSELSARIHAVARRYVRRPEPVLQVGCVQISRAERQVAGPDGPVKLTAREWAVLDALAAGLGKVVPKSRIEEVLYEFGAEVESNTVEVYVSRLRRKMGPEVIETVRGLGYRMPDDRQAASGS